MELNYSVQVGANSLSITPRISIKNLMVLVDHWYEEGKITSWETRRELINRLAESYQAQSNNRPEEANEKINFVQDDVISKGLIQKIVVF
jgi:polyhydroxyalkanoate synthesis regulator phasin